MDSFTGNSSHGNSTTNSSSPAASAASAGFTSPASLANYQFDFGLGPSRPSSYRPLKGQSNPSFNPSPSPARPSPPYQPGKPSWTHQSAASATRSGLANPPPSVAGDIFGKSWAPSSSSRIGTTDSNPNLFGDLVGSALGAARSSTKAPLKSAPKTSFSLNNLADSLPKRTTTSSSSIGSNSTMKHSQSWGLSDQFNITSNTASNQMGGGQPVGSMAGSTSMNSSKDPFASFAGFGSKPASNPPIGTANAPIAAADDFGAFHNANFAKSDGFGISPQTFASPAPLPAQQAKSGGDSLDMLFSSSGNLTAPAAASFPEANDWDVGVEFGGAVDGGGATTELEGLPPPPAGVTASSAKIKGLDNHKQGQFADAIKWLSWAVVLLEKSHDNETLSEALTCRACCYKEVGEYKKAVMDCTKVLEHDKENVAVLLQRALLYESMEKYKLGAEDLRMVMKIDPGNRLARSTIHRLTKLAA